MRRLKHPTRPAGGSVELQLDLHRIVLDGQAEARDNRPTWVSTGRPGRPKADAAHDVGRLAPDAGQGDEVVEAVGTSPPKRSTSAAAMPMRLRVLFW